MNVKDYLKSDFLSGSELETPKVVTIKNAESQELNDDEKIVLSFHETEKGLPLNKTRLKTMVEFFGYETGNWVSQRIMLVGSRLQSGKFQGQWTVNISRAPAAPVAPVQTTIEEAF